MPVLSISYIPLGTDGEFNSTFADMYNTYTLAQLRAKISMLNNLIVMALDTGSKFHGYEDAAATPSVSYSIIDSKEVLSALPRSQYQSWPAGTNQPDYFNVLGNVNICNYVDNLGVKEVWLWGYHQDGRISHCNETGTCVGPVESDMSMGYASRASWNYADYGDWSNSMQINDLPTCNHTYTLYQYNYDRDLPEAVEDHTHQLEAIMRGIDSGFKAEFFGPCGTQPSYACGWTHYPPNIMQYCSGHDYQWFSQAPVQSYCEDWKPLEMGTSQSIPVQCTLWTDALYGADRAQWENWWPSATYWFIDKNVPCPADGGLSYKVWWMQNVPGKDNGITNLTFSVRNVWELVGDFDSQAKKKCIICQNS